MAFTGFVQASHVHSDDSKIAGHDCSICPIAHAGVLSSANYEPTPVFIRTSVITPPTQISKSSDFILTVHIRPPPIAKA
jgi:hypothetical protein